MIRKDEVGILLEYLFLLVNRWWLMVSEGLEYLTISFASSVEIEMGEDLSDSDGEFRNRIKQIFKGFMMAWIQKPLT